MPDKRMTDAEVISAWMEPQPELPARYSHLVPSPLGWWVLGPINGGGMRWFPSRSGRGLTLDALWEVEERLLSLAAPPPPRFADWGDALDTAIAYALQKTTDWHFHATAEQKARALAAVLRPLVEGAAK